MSLRCVILQIEAEIEKKGMQQPPATNQTATVLPIRSIGIAACTLDRRVGGPSSNPHSEAMSRVSSVHTRVRDTRDIV